MFIDGVVLNTTKGTEHSTIQDAVDNSDPGNRLLVGAGLYEEAVVVDVENLQIIGADASLVIVDGDAEDVFTVEVDSVEIAGMNLEGSKRGIYVDQVGVGGVVIVRDNIIAVGGRGTYFQYVDGAEVTVSGNDITSYDTCVFFSYGDSTDPLTSVQSSTVDVVDNVMVSEDAAGIAFCYRIFDSVVEIARNDIQADCKGIVVYYGATDSTVAIIDNLITAEEAGIAQRSEEYNNSTVTIAGNVIVSGCTAIAGCVNIIESTMAIENNTIEAERGIRLIYDIEDSTVDIVGNTIHITYNYVGIGLCEAIINSTVNIVDNIITADEVDIGCKGISVDDVCGGSSLTVGANTVMNFEYGVYIYAIDCSDDPVTVVIEDNLLQDNEFGLYLSNLIDYVAGTSTITGNDLLNNHYGVYISSITDPQSTPIISGNRFDGNSSYGMYNASGEVVDATENWWGDATGPYHDDTNLDGLGDEIPDGDSIIFDPWYIDEDMTTLSDD